MIKPEVFKPLVFVLILGGSSPRFSELMTYFYRDVLKFSSTFLSNLGIISYSTLMIGSIFYHGYLKNIQYKKLIFIAQVILTFVNLFDLVLVTGFYSSLHTPASVFAIGEDVIGSTVHFTFKTLPLLVLSAKICPIGNEATFYSIFTSVGNISFALSGLFGSFLIYAFDVKTGQYELTWVLIIIQCVTKLIPLLFLNLLPSIETQTEEIIELELLEDDKIENLANKN